MQYEAVREQRWRLTKWYPKAALAVLIAVVCSAYALIVIGARVLNPLNLTWLVGDPATAYLGWAFFRQEPHLTLPLTWSHALGFPFGEPAAYLDSIPIAAVLSWCVNLLVRQEFQYLGIYFLLCCVLQFYFGYRITRRICHGNQFASIMGAGLFLTAPPFTWRAYGHFALASHWVILAALDQLMAGSGPPSRGQTAWRGALCFIAAGINPYIAAMTLLVVLATYTRPLLTSRRHVLTCLSGMGTDVLCVAAGFALFGFIGSSDITQYAAGDYGYYSMNFLAPIDPGATGGLLLKQQAKFPGQYEGNNYLGLGMLLLGIVSVARAPSSLRDLFLRTSVPAIVVTLLSLAAALSTKITYGQDVLYQVPLPHPVFLALAAFHASGRLFWPGYYLIFIAVISAASRSFRSGWLPVALGVALMIQFADLAPLRASIHSNLQASSAPPAPSGPDWQALGQTQRHLVVLPAWQCSPNATNPEFAIFGRLALQQQMTVNSFYAARYSAKQIQFFCSEQISDLDNTGLLPDTAYVFHRESAGLLASLEYNGNYCRFSDKYILCSRVGGHSGADPSIFSGLRVLRTGDMVDFAAGRSTAGEIAIWGWSVPEPWGCWAQGHLADVVFRLPHAPQNDVILDLSVLPFLSPARPRQHVEVLANNQPVAHTTFEQAAVSDLHLVIPKQIIESDGIVRLIFKLPDAISPAAVGLNSDTRELSIGVTRLHLLSEG